MKDLHVLQKRIRILLVVVRILFLLSIVLLTGYGLYRNFIFAYAASWSLVIMSIVQFYIRKKCICQRCGYVLPVKVFLEIEDWECPNGEHKIR